MRWKRKLAWSILTVSGVFFTGLVVWTFLDAFSHSMAHGFVLVGLVVWAPAIIWATGEVL